jgi:predicted Zn finger-like uncharacterized protein
VKFLCDRCKTRYSIGDDRVRGKILKIRCKNCANVITVREGMSADDDDRRGRPTTAAPFGAAPPAPSPALATAFAEQLAKPPPALEEEWYVSIDGVQAGPFGLAEAQRWVGSKVYDADLHCWSEGFDDWLPVDKVSHFRGLRKKPPAPPVRVPPAAPRPSRPSPVEDEPKPLFAATMASLEKASAAPAIRMPSIVPASRTTPANGMQAKANGTGPSARLTTPVPAKPISTKTNGMPSAAQSALAAAFDVPSEPEAAVPDGAAFKSVQARSVATPSPADVDHDDDNLDIGEVSRVVNLADLAKSAGAQRAKRAAAVGRATGSTPKLDPAAIGLATSSNPALRVPDAGATVPEGLTAAPVVAQAHRRGLILLISVAAVLLAGVAVLVVLMLGHDQATDDPSQGTLGPAHTIDTSRPEEVVREHMSPTPDGSAATQVAKQTQRHYTGQRIGPSTVETPEIPGVHLKPEEIEDMAQKQSAGTQRCYMRAQRGAEGVMLGDLKKITVTLAVDKSGSVTDVSLSDHGTDTLGSCLSGQIKRWKFRESAGGQFRIVLAFAN